MTSPLSQTAPCRPWPAPASRIAQNLRCRIASRYPGDAAAGMRARAAQIQTGDRHPVVGVAEHRPSGEELVERERAVEDVAAGQAELAFEVERRQHTSPEHAAREVRRNAIHRG